MEADKNYQIAQLHYITQDVDGYTHPELIELACKGGADWVQLRVKDAPHEEWLKIAMEAKSVCDKYHARLIINDNVLIAKTINAHGVHLGKEDMSPREAREILGDDFIIGGTANSIDDVIYLLNMPVDYIGLGPFRFTSTKKNLSPVLGLDEIQDIFDEVESELPIIAIGGITLGDVDEIMAIGVHGIAVSSAINLADDKQKRTSEFLLKLKE